MAPNTPSADAAAAVAPRPADPVASALRAWALAALLALIALGLAWELWLAPTGSGTLAIKVVPLALCVGGLLRHRMYTFRWLSLLLWLYFGEGVLRATTESGVSMWLAIGEILLSLVLFGVSAAYIRWRLRNAAAEGPREAAA
jgi:uncharacterized membrane protein